MENRPKAQRAALLFTMLLLGLCAGMLVPDQCPDARDAGRTPAVARGPGGVATMAGEPDVAAFSRSTQEEPFTGTAELVFDAPGVQTPAAEEALQAEEAPLAAGGPAPEQEGKAFTNGAGLLAPAVEPFAAEPFATKPFAAEKETPAPAVEPFAAGSALVAAPGEPSAPTAAPPPEPPQENLFAITPQDTFAATASPALGEGVPFTSVAPSPSAALPADGFALEVIGETPRAPARRVLIYHTHTYEAYEQQEGDPYPETEQWRTADARHNVVRVGEELAGLLRGLGMEVVHDATAFEPPVLSSAYARSLEMLTRRRDAGERYDLYIDLHRDAYAAQAGPNTVSAGSMELARLMFLIGKGEGQTAEGFAERPNWEENLQMAQRMTEALNRQAQGLCKDVRLKSGRFNQHIDVGCVLVEVGNNRNTLAQALAAMPWLADAIAQALQGQAGR